MLDYDALRAILGFMQAGIVWILWRNDIGYLWRFGLLMFASAAWNLAPAYPLDNGWKHYVQVPAYVILLALMAAASLEFFAFLRRRTFIEERTALLTWAGIMGLIPVWIFWWFPGENWYQSFMLARQYLLMWLAGSYIAGWVWLRAIRPVHAEIQIADHGEFWGFWLISAAAISATTKWGAIWRFSQWQGSGTIWRLTSDIVMLAQICICFAFWLNLWKWKQAEPEDVVPVSLSGPQAPASYLQRRQLTL